MMRSTMVIVVLSVPCAASNLVGTFGMSDTNTAVGSAAGVVSVDGRVVPSVNGLTTGLSVLAGLTDDVELGVGGVTAIDYRAGFNAGVVAPWLRGHFLHAGSSNVSLLAGTIIDLSVSTRSQAGVELLGTQTFGWGSFDVNFGVATVFHGNQFIGHLSGCANVTLPSDLVLLIEAFGYVQAAGPYFGQRVGLAWVATRHLAVDLSLGVVEDPSQSAPITYLPQVGTTVNF